MRVDPTETTHPERFEELRNWMAGDTAKRHQPVWLVVNPVARASVVVVRLRHPDSDGGRAGARGHAGYGPAQE